MACLPVSSRPKQSQPLVTPRPRPGSWSKWPRTRAPHITWPRRSWFRRPRSNSWMNKTSSYKKTWIKPGPKWPRRRPTMVVSSRASLAAVRAHLRPHLPRHLLRQPRAVAGVNLRAHLAIRPGWLPRAMRHYHRLPHLPGLLAVSSVVPCRRRPAWPAA
ncbi:hypothetical protein D3C76_1305610 [compost metagenome]